MVLTRNEIIKEIENKAVVFEPMIDGFQLQPHAVDLRLGSEFFIPKKWKLTEKGREAIIIDPFDYTDTENYENLSLKFGQYFELLPGEFIIAKTLEKIELNSRKLMAVLFPRSSINRRGLAVDLSGIIDTGYKGKLMIPIMNNTSKQVIRIYPGERICQIVFQELSSTLSLEEINMHGLQRARYSGNEKGFAGGKPDKKLEINLIKAGKIKELKSKYELTFNQKIKKV
jgi:dCTP deaminase